MNRVAIKLENVGKEYRLGEVGTGMLSQDLNRWWARVRGREDPSSVVDEHGTGMGRDDGDFWALKNISADIEEGDVFGIIGKNGAGKSTLLKVISRITAPTTGVVKVKGRIASLLEVGTGMHPELTARENIYLNGAVLGMRRREIKSRFDEIVDFSGCERFVDTPLKRYSTGMRVRLGFSVAAFLDAEILVIDEVLAVGDEEFQKRALGKMDEITKHSGRTLLFVSHNLPAVKKICRKGICLNNGEVEVIDSIDKVIETYRRSNATGCSININREELRRSRIDGFEITDIDARNQEGVHEIASGDDLHITITYRSDKNFKSPAFVVQIKDELNQEIIRLSTMPISGYKLDKLYRKGKARLVIQTLPLVKGRYSIDIGFVREKVEWYLKLDDVITMDVQGRDVYNSGFEVDRTKGLIWVAHEWKHISACHEY